jgi:hypothetical protein
MKTEKLPDGILESDLKYPDYQKDRLADYFELWNVTGLGWVIPTLLIKHSRRADRSDRTYATTLDGKACRVGLGPHVLRRVTVYVAESRKAALQKYLDIKLEGQKTSNQIRDRISTRRAQTALRRRDIFGLW